MSSRAPWTEALEQQYREINDQEVLAAYRTAAALGAVLFPLFGVLDWLVHPEHLDPLFLIRFTTSFLFLLLALASRKGFYPGRPFPASLFILGLASASITALCVVLGGYASPYYGGINLVTVAAAVLFPWNVRDMTIAVGLITGIYWLAVLIQAGFEIQRAEAFINNSFFLFATGVIAVASAGLSERLRRNGFLRWIESEQARAALELREQFISVASHELKTPLSALSLQAQHLRRAAVRAGQSPLPADGVSRSAETINKCVQHLTALVDEILDLSKIRSGNLQIQRTRVDLCELTRAVLAKYADQLAADRIELSFRGERGIEGEWDPLRLEQVITNLLTNAVKYGGGKPIEIHIHAENGEALLHVRDQGPGIARENQARVFDRFERATDSEVIHGLGLGLHIAQEIARAHGGAIDLESEAGRGSTFTLRLPLGRNADGYRSVEME